VLRRIGEAYFGPDVEILGIVTQAGGARRIAVASDGLGRWDSALVVFVQDLRSRLAEMPLPQAEIDISALPAAARRILALADSGGSAQPATIGPAEVSWLAQIGTAALGGWSEMAALAVLVGEAALGSAAALMGRARTRVVDVLQFMREAGAAALGIVAIVNGLVGAILAFVGAVQLRRFGAGIYVADLVGIATVREMAAVMTAIVMAGRTGGAYAAQLATMQGNEEIDALKVLGIPIFDFLVLPRMTALVAMMPLLYFYACAVGLLGGFLVGTGMLDLTPVAFLEQARAAVAGRQFLFGLVKSIAFGALIALAGCHIGLRAGRTAADVGHAATTAVVAGIVGVIALDAVLAVCANALGI
jgi:phospholipid/cholesterol/gamma-HCH transport system permease protein